VADSKGGEVFSKTFFEKKVLHSKKLSKRDLLSHFQKFYSIFSKNRGFLGQRPKSPLARGETPFASQQGCRGCNPRRRLLGGEVFCKELF